MSIWTKLRFKKPQLFEHRQPSPALREDVETFLTEQTPPRDVAAVKREFSPSTPEPRSSKTAWITTTNTHSDALQRRSSPL